MSRSEAARHAVTVLRPQDFEGLELTRTYTARAAQPWHLHDEYQIGVIHKGTGVLRYRGARHTLFPGIVAVVQAGEAHSCFTNVREGWRFSIVYAAPGLFREVLPEGRQDAAAYFSAPLFRNVELARAVLALFGCFERPAGRLEQGTRLMHVLTRLIGFCSGAPPSERPPRRVGRAVGLVKAYLHDRVGEDVTLSDLEALTGLSKFHLLRQFRAAAGLTPHEYQTSLRVSLAKARLRRGEPLARIAAETGFADQPHFTRTFKRLVGVTPGQYRQRA